MKIQMMVVTFAALLLSQTGTVPLRFETASVRPVASDDEVTGSRIAITRQGNRLVLRKDSLRLLLIQAFDLPNLSEGMNRIVGLPTWGDDEQFAIEAVAAGNPTVAQKRQMLQSLLVDRFRLVSHRETRSLPVYAVVMAKTGSLGPKLRRSAGGSECAPVAGMELLNSSPCGRIVSGLVPNARNIIWCGARKVTMDTIVTAIGGLEKSDRPVVNRTGLTGEFNFIVQWEGGVRSPDADTPDGPPSNLSMLETLREQLGLRLLAQTAPVDVIVIDRVERPRPNP